MARTRFLEQVKRAVRIGELADARDLRTREALERVAAAEHAAAQRRAAGRGAGGRGIGRREFMGGLAGTLALAAAGRGFSKQAGFDGRIAIVGAGMAGIACAHRLADKGIAATLYEASPTRVGGRIHSTDAFPGQVAELGGELIDTTHQTMRGYATLLGLELESLAKAPGETKYHFFGQGYTEEEVVDEYRELAKRMRPDLKHVGAPTAASYNDAEEALDLTDLATYLDARAQGLPLIRSVLDVAYTIEYGRELHEQSCLAMLLFIHLDGRRRFAPFGVFSDERFHVVGGNDQIPRLLAERLPGPVVLGARLTALARNASGEYVLTFQDGSTEVADAVVLTLPFSVLRGVALDPSLGLSDARRAVIDTYLYGTNAKTMIGFEGVPWHELHGGNGDVYSDLPNLQNTWETNYSKAVATSVLTDYSGGDRALALQAVSDAAPWGACGSCHGAGGGPFLAIDDALLQQQADAFLTDLDAVMPGVKARATRLVDPATGLERYRLARGHWWSQSTSRGSYTANGPGYFTRVAGLEAQPAGLLKFAGEHTDSFYDWQGFMEGAALSGIAAAEDLLADVKAGRL